MILLIRRFVYKGYHNASDYGILMRHWEALVYLDTNFI